MDLMEKKGRQWIEFLKGYQVTWMVIIHFANIMYTMTNISTAETGLGSVLQDVNNGYLSRWGADLAKVVLFLGLICNFCFFLL